MTLDELQVRSRLIGQEVEKATQTLYILQGHKQEVDFQIADSSPIWKLSSGS